MGCAMELLEMDALLGYSRRVLLGPGSTGDSRVCVCEITINCINTKRIRGLVNGV